MKCFWELSLKEFLGAAFINLHDCYIFRVKSILDDFKEVDIEGAGLLTPDEIKAAMLAKPDLDVSEGDVDAFIKEADVNQDGKISLTEWLNTFLDLYD